MDRVILNFLINNMLITALIAVIGGLSFAYFIILMNKIHDEWIEYRDLGREIKRLKKVNSTFDRKIVDKYKKLRS